MHNFLSYILIVFIFALGLSAETFYVSQSGGRAHCAGDTRLTQAGRWFNDSSAWKSPKIEGKIGPGDTVYVCGNWTFPAGQTALIFQGSGTDNDHKITLKFDSRVIMSSSYWPPSGAIAGSKRNFIVIDGGIPNENGIGAANTSGSIKNIANGTLPAYPNQQATVAVNLSACNNCEVKNLNTLDLYIRAEGSADCFGGVSPCNHERASGVLLDGGSHNSIHNITCTWGQRCIFHIYHKSPETAHNMIFNNDVSLSNHGIDSGASNIGDTQDDLSIYENHIHDLHPWSGYPGNHGDCIHVHAVQPGSVITNLQIYNNVCDGSQQYPVGGHGGMTSWYFVEATSIGGSIIGAKLYHNVAATDDIMRYGLNGMIFLKGVNSPAAVGNTIYSPSLSKGSCIYVGSGGSQGTVAATLVNNLCYNFQTGIAVADVNTTLSVSDYNLFYGLGTNQMYCWGKFKNLRNWQESGCGQLRKADEHSSTEQPKFTDPSHNDFHLTAQTHRGMRSYERYSVDKDGAVRTLPSIGAYEYVPKEHR